MPDLCRYFAAGYCKSGGACRFSHNDGGPPVAAPRQRRPQPTSQAVTVTACREYAKGTCKFGDRCRYLHWATGPSSSSPSSSSSSASSTGSPPTAPAAPEPPAAQSDAAALPGAAPVQPSAEAPASRKALCRYFSMGNCRSGDSCQFQHSVRCVDAANPGGRAGAATDHGRNPPRDDDDSDECAMGPAPAAAPPRGSISEQDVEARIAEEAAKATAAAERAAKEATEELAAVRAQAAAMGSLATKLVLQLPSCQELLKACGGSETCTTVSNPFAFDPVSSVNRAFDAGTRACGFQSLAELLHHDDRWRLAYHGTSTANVVSIFNAGFDPTRRGANGQVYGRGEYFDLSMSLAAQYAKDGVCLVVIVLDGPWVKQTTTRGQRPVEILVVDNPPDNLAVTYCLPVLAVGVRSKVAPLKRQLCPSWDAAAPAADPSSTGSPTAAAPAAAAPVAEASPPPPVVPVPSAPPPRARGHCPVAKSQAQGKIAGTGPAVGAALLAANLPPHHLEFDAGGNVWHPVGTRLQREFNSAVREGRATFTTKVGIFPYKVDVAAMQQTNVSSNRVRSLRCF